MTDTSAYFDPMTSPGLMTAEELLHLNLPNKRTELVRGVLVVLCGRDRVHVVP